MKFKGIIPALVTPLDNDERINIPVLNSLIEFLHSKGAAGFYVGGATGEGLALRTEERMILASEAVKAAKGRVPCIVQVAATDFNDAIALAKHAEEVGADAISATPPLFFQYTEDNVYNYYKALADAVHIPVMIYYSPAAGFAISAKFAPDVPVVTMNGLSKSHSLCGFRCGWMIISGPRALTEEYRQGIIKLTSMRLCANALSQIVIPAALRDMETPASMVRPGGRIFEQREATVRELMKIDSLSFVKNRAAFYIFPKLDVKKLNITDDKKFAHDLLHATNILIVPGSGFEWQEPDHFRIVMLPEPKVLCDAVARLGNFLDGYRQK